MSQSQGRAEIMPPPSNINDSATSFQSTAKKATKGGKKVSVVWDHFERFTTEDGEDKAKCKYCPKEYFCHPKRNGTSSLNAHMLVCKKRPVSSEDTSQTLLNMQSELKEGEGECTTNVTPGSWRFDQEFCRRKLVEMILKDELPFKLVEGEGFKEFVAALQVKFKLPSRWTIARDIYKLFDIEKEKLKAFFRSSGQSVSITTDTWTSLQRINYMCITAHYVDNDWKLNKKIINFCTVESHKGDIMGRQIDACLREWGIKKVFSVTVDNASSNDTTIGNLRKHLIARGGCLVGGEYLHMRCVAHIVNLVVKDGMNELDSSIEKIRDAVRFVRHSPARLARFKQCCKDQNIDCKSLLCLDVPTRWNSTYLMLEVACKFEKAFELFQVRDPLYVAEFKLSPPDFFDWENGRKLCKILQTFYDVTKRVSGSLYVTSNVFFHEITNMSYLLKEWVKNSALDVREMGVKMKEKFDKYWGDPRNMNKLIFFAVVVDPRHKFEVLSFILIECYGVDIGTSISIEVKDELYKLYDAYKVMLQPSSEMPQLSQVSRAFESSSSSSTPYLYLDKYKKQKILDGELSSELDQYLTEKERTVSLDGKNFDILNWWKVNECRLPILANMARDILSVPISTVASESAFSAGGRVLDPFRSSITPRIVESLLCTQDWLRKSKKEISIEEDLEGIQKLEEAFSSLGIGNDQEDDEDDEDDMET